MLVVFLFTGTGVSAQQADVTVEQESRVDIKPRPLPRPTLFNRTEVGVEAQSQPPREERLDRRDMRMDDRIEEHKGSDMSKERLEMMQENRDDRRENFQERKEAVMEKREERREELKERFNERVLERRQKFQDQYAKRSIRAITQVENIMERFDSHLSKLEENGIDTTVARAELTNTASLLETAKTKFDALKALYPTDEEAEVDTEAVRAAKEEAETAIKAVHESLREVLSIVKGYRAQLEVESETNVEAN